MMLKAGGGMSPLPVSFRAFCNNLYSRKIGLHFLPIPHLHCKKQWAHEQIFTLRKDEAENFKSLRTAT